MTWGRYLSGVLVLALWGVCVPTAFVVLYSVVELQSAARTAAGADDRLANLQVISMARAIAHDQAARDGLLAGIGDQSDRINGLRPVVNATQITLDRARGLLRTSTLEISAIDGLGLDRNACVADPATLTKCAAQHDGVACAADWALESDCYYRALAAASTRPGSRAPGSPLSADVGLLRAEMARARDAGYDFNAKAKENNEFVRREQQFQASLKATDADLVQVEKDSKTATVANGFLQIRDIPLVLFLFLMPPGVSVALFTALMAAIAALVSAFVTAPGAGPRGTLVDMVLVKPALGGLAGFTVFFVISAGASFLTQPSGGAAEAVNSLSPSALGALGIFAGLASDTAMSWLKARASAFFKTDEGG